MGRKYFQAVLNFGGRVFMLLKAMRPPKKEAALDMDTVEEGEGYSKGPRGKITLP